MKILLGNLKEADELAAFLEPRIGTKAKVSGSEIEIEDGSTREGVKPRHVKTYVKRYLFQKGQRKTFRVLVQGRELRVVELEGGEEEEEEKKPSKPEESKEGEKKEEAEERPEKEEEAVEKAEEKEETPEKKEGSQKKPRKKKAGESG